MNISGNLEVQGNASQLLQLFQNLIENALKYRTEAPPVVDITFGEAQVKEGEAPAWQISVADNGIGVKPEHGESVFNIFRRLHGKDEYSGAGVGLAICKRVVGLHGGRIWVEPGPEGGSVFSFTLSKAPRLDVDTFGRRVDVEPCVR